MIALIKAALEGLAAIPKILDYFQKLNLMARLNRIEKNQELLRKGFDELHKAKTPSDIQKAANAVSAAWNKRL